MDKRGSSLASMRDTQAPNESSGLKMNRAIKANEASLEHQVAKQMIGPGDSRGQRSRGAWKRECAMSQVGAPWPADGAREEASQPRSTAIEENKHAKRWFWLSRAILPFAALLLFTTPSWAIDGVAAEKLVKDNNCFKCHAVDRKKDGPAYRDVAAKFRAESDAQAKLIYHVTSGELVKFPDGHEERHKKIKVKDEEELKNLAGWILSLEGGKKY
jgi:cytochrome c